MGLTPSWLSTNLTRMANHERLPEPPVPPSEAAIRHAGMREGSGSSPFQPAPPASSASENWRAHYMGIAPNGVLVPWCEICNADDGTFCEEGEELRLAL